MFDKQIVAADIATKTQKQIAACSSPLLWGDVDVVVHLAAMSANTLRLEEETFLLKFC